MANEERPENAADSSGGSWKKPPVHAFFSIILGLIILASLTGVLHKIVLLKEPWELGNRAVGPDGTAPTLDPLSSLVRGRLGSSKKASENGPTAPSPSSDGRDEK